MDVENKAEAQLLSCKMRTKNVNWEIGPFEGLSTRVLKNSSS
jgi:hypothetical protein